MWFSQVTNDFILQPGNAVSKGIFFRVKVPKRKYYNDVILAAIRQEPGIKVPKRRAQKYVVFQSILLSKEPRGNKRFLLFGFPGGNSFLFCSFLVGRSGLRQNEIKSTTNSNSVGLAAFIALCRIPFQNPKVQHSTEQLLNRKLLLLFFQILTKSSIGRSARELSALSTTPSKELSVSNFDDNRYV